MMDELLEKLNSVEDTFEGVIKNAEDAKREWIQTALDDGRNI